MASRQFTREMTVLFLATFSLVYFADSVQGWGALSQEENLELERQLKFINKPAIKSFQIEYGDIIDCVDMYKQLAFDHPLLKNHKIQMRPKTTPKVVQSEASTTYTSSKYIPKNINCPPGSVAIKRATKEDLIITKRIKSLGLNYPTNTSPRSIDVGGHHSAVLEFKYTAYGARGRINLWNPAVTTNQFSLASMWIVNGPREQINSLQTGWIVNTALFPNGTSRLYNFWTADGYQKTGCFNVLCPGFVQVSPDIPLGLMLPSSTYGGNQIDILLSIHQDRATGNWMLMFNDDKYVGYWPKLLLPGMTDGASFVSWGGEIYSPTSELSPAMGSGHFPDEGYSKAAYIKQLKVIDNDNSSFVDPFEDGVKIWADKAFCYNAKHLVSQKVDWQSHVFFGGPGNCTF